MSFNFVIPEFNINGAGTPPLQFFKRGFNLTSNGSSPFWQDIILSGNGSLTLTNAKANGLNYVKLYGGTEQRNLPSGYTEYDGLIGDGNAYIDLDCTLDQDDEIEFEFTMPSTGITSKNIFGYRDSASSQAITAMIASSGSNTFISDFNNSNYTDYRLSFALSSSTRYRVVINKNGRYIYDSTNTLVASNTTACNDTITTGNVLLFGIGGYPAYTSSGSKFNSTIHRCLIKGKRDVVPAGNGTAYGMYDKLNGVFYPNANTEGSFTVGNALVPSPDTPMDIISNNGVLKFGALGKNLFNPTKVLFGYYRDRTTGIKQQSSSNFMSSDDGYIPCLPNTTYTFVGTNKTNGTYSKYNTIYFFDSAKNYLGASPYDISQPTTGTTPNNCYYLQVRSNPLDNSTPIQDALEQFNWQLEQGSTATPYEPYRAGIYTDGTTETVEVTGKNLFNENDVTLGYFYEDNGTYTANINTFTSGKIPMNAGATVTFSRGSFVNNVFLRVHAFDSNDNWIDLVAKSSTPNGLMCTGTTPANTSYIRACGAKRSSNDEIDNECQLELGSTATTYEPYYNGGTATAEMLLKVGTYQDVQSVLDGGVTRKVGIKVMTGNETFQAGTNGWISENTITNNLKDIYTPICTHFRGTDETPTANSNTVRVYYTSQNIPRVYFGVDKTIYTSAEVFKQFLADQYNAGNPVIIVYPLATATTETVTAQPLTIQAGSNIVEITQASINNLGLEVSYKGTV